MTVASRLEEMGAPIPQWVEEVAVAPIPQSEVAFTAGNLGEAVPPVPRSLASTVFEKVPAARRLEKKKHPGPRRDKTAAVASRLKAGVGPSPQWDEVAAYHLWCVVERAVIDGGPPATKLRAGLKASRRVGTVVGTDL